MSVVVVSEFLPATWGRRAENRFPKHFAAGDYNLYRYCHNDPVNRVDPTGLYGRGSGFSDEQSKKFAEAQQKVADAIAKVLKSMDPKAFEKDFGAGSATPEKMSKVSGILGKVLGALQDDGTKGFMANGVTPAQLAAGGKSPNVIGAGDLPGKEIRVNTGHPQYNNPFQLAWTIGHESGHNFGLRDSAYKWGTAAEMNAYRRLPASTALGNPDNLMEFTMRR